MSAGLRKLARQAGINYSTLYNRIHDQGLTPEEAVALGKPTPTNLTTRHGKLYVDIRRGSDQAVLGPFTDEEEAKAIRSAVVLLWEKGYVKLKDLGVKQVTKVGDRHLSTTGWCKALNLPIRTFYNWMKASNLSKEELLTELLRQHEEGEVELYCPEPRKPIK